MNFNQESVKCFVCGEQHPKNEMTAKRMGPHQLQEFVCPDHES